MRSRHYESDWIVVTYDGLFLGAFGDVVSEYPDAKLFAREGLARHAARAAVGLGPYNVMTTDDYANADR